MPEVGISPQPTRERDRERENYKIFRHDHMREILDPNKLHCVHNGLTRQGLKRSDIASVPCMRHCERNTMVTAAIGGECILGERNSEMLIDGGESVVVCVLAAPRAATKYDSAPYIAPDRLSSKYTYVFWLIQFIRCSRTGMCPKRGTESIHTLVA